MEVFLGGITLVGLLGNLVRQIQADAISNFLFPKMTHYFVVKDRGTRMTLCLFSFTFSFIKGSDEMRREAEGKR